jgi:DNA invertase Pin-like site-specific DNA recombinase
MPGTGESNGLRFAFWGRCSTEDQQDPQASRGWQLTRSRTLIEPRRGVVVAEYFDVDESRSVPPSRRPRARSLLAALADLDRGFDAVVVGEPHRAFYGNQFGMTFPLFEHYRVPLWVPEVGGPIDPGNEAHELVMLVFGGMSKGERNRIKIRVRTAMASQAKMEGRFLGGRPPYGYRLADAGPHPNPAKAADGRRLHRLELDPVTSPVVARIFNEFIDGDGLFAIAECLTKDGVPSPSAYDRARNSHRSGIAWAKSAVRAIILNPRYTGHQVWNRQRKDEVLLDVNDVSAGHTTKLRWNDRDAWVWSDSVAHPPIVSVEDFQQAQEILASRGGRQTGRRPKRVANTYLLRGLLHCETCKRRMQAQTTRRALHTVVYYRCRYPQEYALANKVLHPQNVYIREDAVVGQLDRWLAGLFAPGRIETTVEALVGAQESGAAESEAIAAARRQVDECDRVLSQHRAALEAGADPTIVARWMKETQHKRTAAERFLERAPVETMPLDRRKVMELVSVAGNMVALLGQTDRDRKARIYSGLGIRLEYAHDRREVVVSYPTLGAECTLPTNGA